MGRWSIDPSAAFPVLWDAVDWVYRRVPPEEGVPSDGPSIQDSQGQASQKRRRSAAVLFNSKLLSAQTCHVVTTHMYEYRLRKKGGAL